MVDFITKAKTWRRVETASEFAALVPNVERQPYGVYEYVYNPPCHFSSSKKSGQFGDAPGGGIYLGCWACNSDSTMIDRIEEAIGYAIQVRYADGSLRYKYGARGRQIMGEAKKVQKERVPQWCTPTAKNLTVQDVLNARIWFAGGGDTSSGKHGATWWSQGSVWGYRHSVDAGVRLARHGGLHTSSKTGKSVKLRPHASYDHIMDTINSTSQLKDGGYRPAISLSGDEDCPFPLDVGVVDIDYKPEHDAGEEYAGVRDDLISVLRAAGLPVFISRSMNGVHALWRAHPNVDGKVWAPMRQDDNTKRLWRIDIHKSLGIDFFMPGDKRLVVIHPDRPVIGTTLDKVIPIGTPGGLANLLRPVMQVCSDCQEQFACFDRVTSLCRFCQ